MAYGRQTGPGIPGSFPLPNAGATGQSYKANAMHPSAAAGLGKGLANGGRPGVGPGTAPGMPGGGKR